MDGQKGCKHCGLPVPETRNGGEDQFCCGGCEIVYAAIHERGLGNFYDLKFDADRRQPAQTTQSHYEEFDDPSFLGQHASDAGGDQLSIQLLLEGVHCASCVWLIERLPSILAGVRTVRLNARQSVVQVQWDPKAVALSDIAKQLDRFGYPAHAYRGAEVERLRVAEERKHLVRVGIAGALAGNVMLLAFALYGGYFGGMEPRYATLIKGTAFVLTLASVLGPGSVFLKGAWSSLRARTLHMDVPVATALVVGTAWGGVNTIRGNGEVYFESLTAVVFLLLVGRWVQHRQQRRANEAVDLLFSLTPIHCRRWDGERFARVPVSALQPGDRVQVRPGDLLPADGEVRSGTSNLDVSTLTGESAPVSVEVGETVFAGTTNLARTLEITVTEAGSNTRVGALMQMVEQGAQERPEIVLAADRLAHRFVAGVLVLATATALLWLALDASRAIEQTVALLIVTCPCALGLATPLAFQAAIGQAASLGILIKNGPALEKLTNPGSLVLDKTGTLTTGRLQLLHWHGDRSCQPWVGELEAESTHPIAKALAASLEDAGGDFELTLKENIPGCGVQAQVGGRRLQVGSVSWLWPSDGTVPEWLQTALDQGLEQGATPVCVALDGEIIALAALGDRTNDGTQPALRRLEQLGWDPKICSGDHAEVVSRLAAELGLESAKSRGGVSPEAKRDVVRAERENGPVIMVGDGVNDAAALTAADVGIAVQGSAEASLRSADVFLSQPGIGPLVELMEGAQRTMTVVRRNFAVSIAYNGLAATGAIMGWINPLLAAALMPISSLSVVMLSYRSKMFVPHSQPRE